jgi:hypothetical protein
MASMKVAWRAEEKRGSESPFGGRRESVGGGLGERKKRRSEGII